MTKRFLFTLAFIFSCLFIWAQGLPSGINYQAVARDSKGQPMINKDINFKISLLAGDAQGKTVYEETHSVQTGEIGMFSIIIGQGKALRGLFSEVPWSEKQIWMEVAIDEYKKGKYMTLSASKLMAVPYAFHAGTADGVVGEEASGRNDLGPSAFWKVNGNNMTFPGSMFMGTIDFKDLVFKTNSIEAMRIGANGDINIKNTLNVGVDINVGRDANIGRDANLGRNLNVEGIARFNNTAQSNTKDDGSVIVEGGVGIEKNVNIGGNTEIDGTLGVDGVTTLKNTTESTTKDNGALIVEGGVGIEKNVNIGGNTEIDGTLGVDGVTTLKNTTESTTKDNGALIVEGGVGIKKNVNIGGNTEIDGTLGVDGVTTLKNTIESTTKDNGSLVVEGGVGVEKNINIGGNSALSGNSTIGGTIGVNGVATFNNTTQSTTKDNGAVVIEGGVGIEKNINVGGNSSVAGNASVTGNSTIGGNSTVNGLTGLNGQVTISANVGGGSDSYGAYPLRVEGSEQGVAIKLSVGTPLGANNFLTFFNSSGNAVGGVEGQDYAEKQAWPPNVFDRSIMIATEIKSGVGIGLSFIPTCTGGFIVSCGVSGSSIALAAADLILATANLIAFEVFLSQYIGVTYSSGSADYAEWLERAYPEEEISAGDIVAVNGGKITKYTEKAQQFMAISTNPAILGNVPTDGNVSNMEKVAFMGQIPVKVRGIVLIGDYILPSGLHDGIGIAVSPDEITAEQYRKIVGVAWSNSFLEKGISYINMAIGLNSNDVSILAAKQEKKIKELENQNIAMEKKFKSLEDRLSALEKGTIYIPAENLADISKDIPVIASPKVMTREETLAYEMPSELNDNVMKEAMAYLESEYKRRGINIANHPGLHKLLTDMDFQAEVIQKTKETYKATYQNFIAGVKH